MTTVGVEGLKEYFTTTLMISVKITLFHHVKVSTLNDS